MATEVEASGLEPGGSQEDVSLSVICTPHNAPGPSLVLFCMVLNSPILGPIHWTPSISLAPKHHVHVQKRSDFSLFSTFDLLIIILQLKT